MLPNEPRNMGCAKLTSSSRDQVPDVKLRSVHCRLLAWRSVPSRTSPRLHTTVRVRQSVVASKAFEHPYSHDTTAMSCCGCRSPKKLISIVSPNCAHQMADSAPKGNVSAHCTAPHVD